MSSTHYLVENHHAHVHVSKARRTDSGRIGVEHITIPVEEDAVTRELLHCMRIEGRKVRIDADRSFETCKRFGLVQDAPSATEETSETPGNVVTASRARISSARRATSSVRAPQRQLVVISEDDAAIHVPPVQQHSNGEGDTAEPPQPPQPAQPPQPPRPPHQHHDMERTGSRRGRAAWAHLSDAEKLTASIRKLDHFYDHLKVVRTVDSIRTVHAPFAGIECALLSAKIVRDGFISRYVGFSWQITSSPPRFVTATFFLSAPDENGSSTLRSSCTCAPSRRELRCSHVHACFQNTSFMKKVEGTVHGHLEYLHHTGPAVHVGSPWPVVHLVRVSNPLRFSASSADQQLRRLKNRWAPWLVLDTTRRLFVTVCKRPKRPFRCFLCRGNDTRRCMCPHESSCRRIAMQSNLYDLREEDESTDTGSDEEGSADRVAPTRQDVDIWTYCPVHITRPVLPCRGEQLSTQKMYERISSFPNSEGFFFKDARFVCKNFRCPSGVISSQKILSLTSRDAMQLLS